jgi:hypothetical protein
VQPWKLGWIGAENPTLLCWRLLRRARAKVLHHLTIVGVVVKLLAMEYVVADVVCNMGECFSRCLRLQPWARAQSIIHLAGVNQRRAGGATPISEPKDVRNDGIKGLIHNVRIAGRFAGTTSDSQIAKNLSKPSANERAPCIYRHDSSSST